MYKRYFYTIAAAIAALLLPISIFAQVNLSGTIIDQMEQPIEFVNVVLTDEAGNLVKGSITEAAGTFSFTLEKGNYQLTCSFIGYQDLQKNIVLEQDQALGKITLETSANELETVVVQSRRPTITRKIDRLVFSIKNTMLSEGDAWEVLRKTPGVSASSDGKLQIHGKAGVIVMIDERPVRLSSEELKNMLQGMSAGEIAAIEVISNPPAKYGAEGAGIINIKRVTKRNKGYNASIVSKYTQAQYAKYSNGLTGSYKGKSMDLYANYNFDHGKRLSLEDSEINFLDGNKSITSSWDEDADILTNYKSHNYRLSSNMYLSDKSTLSIGLNGHIAPDKKENNAIETNVYDQENVLDARFENDNNQISTVNNTSYELSFIQDLQKPGQSLSFDFDYTRYRKDEGQDVLTNFYDNNLDFQDAQAFMSTAIQDIDIYSGKVDFSTPLDSASSLETGFRYNSISTDNDLSSLNQINGELIQDPRRTNRFVYDENTYATYASYTRMFSRLVMQLGLRGEYTRTEGNSITLEKVNTKDRFYLFPTAFFRYPLGKGSSLGFSYGRRISRPQFALLNPFQYYYGPYSYIEGNPFLKPATTNKFAFAYTIKNKYFFKLFYYDTNNSFTQLSVQDNEEQAFKYLAVNLNKSILSGLSFNTSLDPTAWWNVFFQMNYYYKNDEFFDPESNEIVSNGRWNNYTLFALNDFTLSRKKGLSMEIQGIYSSAKVQGGFNLSATSEVSIGIRKSILNNQGSIALYVADIFNDNIPVLKSEYGTQSHQYREKAENQSVRLTMTYKLGNQKLRIRPKQSTAKDEKGRL